MTWLWGLLAGLLNGVALWLMDKWRHATQPKP